MASEHSYFYCSACTEDLLPSLALYPLGNLPTIATQSKSMLFVTILDFRSLPCHLQTTNCLLRHSFWRAVSSSNSVISDQTAPCQGKVSLLPYTAFFGVSGRSTMSRVLGPVLNTFVLAAYFGLSDPKQMSITQLTESCRLGAIPSDDQKGNSQRIRWQTRSSVLYPRGLILTSLASLESSSQILNERGELLEIKIDDCMFIKPLS